MKKDQINMILQGDALKVLKTLPDNHVNCIVTSPPYYGLRDYGCDGQIGLEESPEEYINRLVLVFREARRVLNDDGTLWLNIGDSYNNSGRGATSNNQAEWIKNSKDKNSFKGLGTSHKATKIEGLKPKDLIGIPWMLAFALRADGWYLRQDIIWHKPNPMPESVQDRCTKSHEYIFLFSKSNKYYFDNVSIMEKAEYDGRKDTRMKGSHKYSQIVTGLPPQTMKARPHERWVKIDDEFMRNKRDVWTIPTKPFKDAHFAVFPESLIVDCIKAGCPENGIVLDMFSGSGTTFTVARKLNRNAIGIELNPDYIKISERRIYNELGMFA